MSVKAIRGFAGGSLLGIVLGGVLVIIVYAANCSDEADSETEYADALPTTQPTEFGDEVSLMAVIATAIEVDESELPTIAKAWWFDQHYRLDLGDDLFRLVSTPFGTAFKTEDLLWGQCASTEYAYRRVDDADARYDVRCYDPNGQTQRMPLPRVTIPDLVGLEHDLVAVSLHPNTPVLFRWIADDKAPVGRVISQHPLPSDYTAEYFPVLVTVSAGGPVVHWQKLPPDIKAWLVALDSSAARALHDGTFVLVETEHGAAYKSDAILFGPCDAVRAAYGTFPDDHYDTLTPEPCSRLSAD